MLESSDYQIIFDTPLEIPEELVQRGEESIIGDKNVRLWLTDNRIALAKGKVNIVPAKLVKDKSLTCYYIPLRCVVHSHPKCRFRWARLIIDFELTAGATIRDMVPQVIQGDKPIEITTTIGAGMKFEAVSKVLSADAKVEYSSSRTLYYPEIVGSGVGFEEAIWDFLALNNDYLHANRELHLLVSVPGNSALRARFNLAAEVTVEGFARRFPLMARTGFIEEVFNLT